MLKPLRYFFLRVYQLKLRSEPEVLAAFTAVCATSVAVSCHVLTLWILYRRMFGDALPRGRSASQAMGAMTIAIVVVAFYGAWVSSGRYLRFCEEFQAETPEQRQVRTVLVVLYALVSFALPAGLMIALAE